MSEEKIKDYIRRGRDRASGLPFVLVYGPVLSGKSALLRRVPHLAADCFTKAKLACVAVDLRSVLWDNPSEPLSQFSQMLAKSAWESKEQLRVEGHIIDLASALTAIRDEALRRKFWGVLITIDHLDFLPNEGIRAICRAIKKMKDEDQQAVRRIGVIAGSARNLAWLRDQEDSPFLAFDRIVLPEPGAGAAHDPLIRTTLEQSGLPLKDDLDPGELDEVAQWALHGSNSNRALRQTLLHAITDAELREVVRSLLTPSGVPDLRGATSAFDSFEETGIIVAAESGHKAHRHGLLTHLFEETLQLWADREFQPDEADGSLAAIVRSVAAYRAKIEASKDLDEAFHCLRHLWNLLNEIREIPEFYLQVEGAHPNDPGWISFTGGRGEMRLLRSREVPEPVLSAFEISRLHRFATVLTDEAGAVTWSKHESSVGVMRLFARVPRKHHNFNETSLRNWTNLAADMWNPLAFLAIHEFGTYHLQRSNELEIDKRSVFVVHGHDVKAFEEVHRQLKVHQLTAITWEDAKQFTQKAVPANLETVQAGLEHAYAIAVLMTGDDLGKKRAKKLDGYVPQPRQNVLIEAGMAMAMNPNRTILIHFGAIREASDFAGLNVVQYDFTAQSREKLEEALRRAGCINGIKTPKRRGESANGNKTSLP